MDDEKPDTRHLVLKPKVIELTEERSRPGDGTALSVQLMHKQNALAEEKAAKEKRRGRSAPSLPVGQPAPALAPVFKPREIVPTDKPAAKGDEEAISVPEMLIENKAAELQTGWWRVKHRKKRSSRRNRDFLLIVGGLDLAIAVLMKVMSNTVSTIYGVAGITLITSTFAWIMFVVNDEY
jgi:hypothetical protein